MVTNATSRSLYQEQSAEGAPPSASTTPFELRQQHVGGRSARFVGGRVVEHTQDRVQVTQKHCTCGGIAP